MALEGTLKDFSLADIFQLIGIQQKTGVLTLKSEEDVVTVSFEGGSVVSADSQKKKLEDLLGSVLAKSGRITETQLQNALRIQKRTLQRLGHILIQERLITHDDLREALRLQITQVVYRLFRWTEGDYSFKQETSIEYDQEHFTPLSAESILMEGIRMIDEWPIIEKKIRSVDMVFTRAKPMAPVSIRYEEEEEDVLGAAITGTRPAVGTREEPPPDAVVMSDKEAKVYEKIDGQRTVQELIDRAGLGDFETCRTLYDLLARGIVQEIYPDAGRPATPTAPRAKASPILWSTLTALLLLGAAASAVTMGLNPINRLPPAHSDPLFDELRAAITRSHVQRLDEAIQVYYLEKRFYPDDLSELARGHLVGPEALRDAWGRELGYQLEDGGYRIVVYGPDGRERPGLSLRRPGGSTGMAPATDLPAAGSR
jgi:hypothetical protein